MDAQQPSVPTTKPATSDAARPTLKTLRITTPPTIDGRLDDEIWAQAPAADHFRQRDPNEGQPATERTEIRVLFDDNALYIGARMFDSQPSAISKRLGGRDQWPDADSITVYLDPRHDHRTGVQFTVTAAGVQGDGVLSNDNFRDDSWDAMWSSAVSHDDKGLVGRAADSVLAAPLQGRRPPDLGDQRLPVHPPQERNGVARVLAQERQRPRLADDAPRGARRRPSAPAAGDRALRRGAAGVRRRAGRRSLQRRRAHVRLARRGPQGSVTGGLVLDATINPDFGQAEVDPAVVNLTAYETFFPEKRRFFIEGSEIFNNFGRGGSNNFFGFNSSKPEPLLLASHRTAAIGERRGISSTRLARRRSSARRN